ncbi:MAG: 23S rRNA (pseudouridine(1915)-N(3))-methyltransferase RlmH [Corallococcus sp.]|nr:23S rRNA (pseudouridine(1915)-N(3))-methyltransferase RlmH [Corallococcus sp.]MCM1395773.1 23S rRNA (pseudouridine(1915)-N(3))-methyltransferase RlmH [Corallococcus sp.]
MKFKIVAVGKIKERYYRDAVDEYVKRLSRFGKVEIIETDECYFNGVPNAKEIAEIIETEGKSLLSKTEGYVIATDICGDKLSSEEFSVKMTEQKRYNSVFTFLVGGSYGLSDEVKRKANLRLSFGNITLPHQLCRVVLCEQIYRACCIENKLPYHK